MSLAKVLRLEDYRGKRAQRLRLSEALHGSDANRLAILRFLREISGLCDADRVATVWVDEYGPGSVHPQVVLDLLMDRPRRFFSAEPLRKAWELGVPGAIDELGEPGSTVPATFAISLGSDGTRAWFLVAETSSGRPLLQSAVRDRLMFLAGECAAVLLHLDLDQVLTHGEDAEAQGFAGWAILKDLEGRESNESAGRRIAQRFVVGRVARMFADEGFVYSAERMTEQVRRARSELPPRSGFDDAEAELWHTTLDALEVGDVRALAEVLVQLGDEVDRHQHVHGALELYACGLEAATAAGSAEAAARAAWFTGRALRRRASWDEARTAYECAARVAEAAGLQEISVHTLVGLAMIKRDLGNIPAARARLDEALAVAESSGARDAIATVHQTFLGLEQIAGDELKSLQHGWVAVATCESQERRTHCMASLAAALLHFGDHSAAEDAWSVVAHTSHNSHYTTYAEDALGHLAALRGDEREFERRASSCDALNWEMGAPSLKAEILQHRGLSYRALGRLDEARAWLTRAVTFAEEHGFNRVLFEAEEALEALRTHGRALSDPQPAPTAPTELRQGLRSMRRELVGTGV